MSYLGLNNYWSQKNYGWALPGRHFHPSVNCHRQIRGCRTDNLVKYGIVDDAQCTHSCQLNSFSTATVINFPFSSLLCQSYIPTLDPSTSELYSILPFQKEITFRKSGLIVLRAPAQPKPVSPRPWRNTRVAEKNSRERKLRILALTSVFLRGFQDNWGY